MLTENSSRTHMSNPHSPHSSASGRTEQEQLLRVEALQLLQAESGRAVSYLFRETSASGNAAARRPYSAPASIGQIMDQGGKSRRISGAFPFESVLS